MEDILSLTPEELAAKLKGMGQSAFRAKQLYQWLVRGVDYNGMTNIPRDLRQKLSEEGPANPVRILKSVVSKLDGTEKYLYELQDGNIVEGVTMRYNYYACPRRWAAVWAASSARPRWRDACAI